MKRSLQLIDVSCDICGGAQASTHVSPAPCFGELDHDFQIVRCQSCGLLYTRPRPSQSAMAALYEAYFPMTPLSSDSRATRDSWRSNERLRRLWHMYCRNYQSTIVARAHGTVLDIGCGSGELMEALRRKGHPVQGLEINPQMAAACRSKGLRVFCADYETATFPQGAFGTIILSHVIEHLPSPKRALQNIWQILEPGGTLFIFCPNADSYFARFFGRRWYQWHVPFHFFHFTPASMSALASATGYRIARMSTATPDLYFAHSYEFWLRRLPPALYRLLWRPQLYRSVAFRAMVAPVFRVLDAILKGRGECLTVELTKE
jgi:SAM-dependent methyltransferase